MTTWLNDQQRLQDLRDEVEKHSSNYEMAMEAWKARGRELNTLYDIIAQIAYPYATMDPVADLRRIGDELERLRHPLLIESRPMRSAIEEYIARWGEGP